LGGAVIWIDYLLPMSHQMTIRNRKTRVPRSAKHLTIRNRRPTAQVQGLPNFSERGSVLSANNFVSPLAALWSFIKVVHECNIYRVLWVYKSVCVCVFRYSGFTCRFCKWRVSLRAL